MKKKWVYLFDEVDDAEKKTKSWDGVRTLLGGKGANLAEMTRIGVPVPPGFIITTEACNACVAGGGEFPEGMWNQVMNALHKVEKATGKKFGDKKNPLLVSCRSGSKFSMPGMMDTVLNIGLNEETAEGMITLTGDARFVYDAYRRLIQMFGTVVMGLDAKPFHQALEEAKAKAGVTEDAEIPAPVLKDLVATLRRSSVTRRDAISRSIQSSSSSWPPKRSFAPVVRLEGGRYRASRGHSLRRQGRAFKLVSKRRVHRLPDCRP